MSVREINGWKCNMDRCKKGQANENIVKNRYPMWLAYDDTMPKLENIDYINASILSWDVKSSKQKAKVIATQGPLSSTVNDFWEMIWQEKVRMIVMLTDFFESSTEKCCIYFPIVANSIMTTNQFTISMVSRRDISKENNNNNNNHFNYNNVSPPLYTDTIFEITKNDNSCVGGEKEGGGGGEKRRIKHIHCSWWNDACAPDRDLFVKFKDSILTEWNRTDYDPIVVHCSAGIGRTGVLTVALEKESSSNSNSDGNTAETIEQIIKSQRQRRAGMVFTQCQLDFLKSLYV